MQIKQAAAILLLIFTMLFSTKAVLAQEERSEAVFVHIHSSESVPAPIRQRMEKSVYSVAEQLLLDKKLQEIRQNSDMYEKIIHEVFDKVLVGYTIRRVEITGDLETVVNIELTPWQDTIHNIKLDIAVEGMTPLIRGMVLKDADGIEQVFQDTLSGLPIGAIDWSNGVLKKKVNSFMEDKLPEFRVDFDMLEVAENTEIKVTLYPLLPVVRTLDLQMRSDTFPNFWLLSMREQMQQEANELIGVPVAFVNRHSSDLAEHYSNMLDSTDNFSRFHVTTETTVAAGENMTLASRSNLEKLRIRGESWFDIGHRHAGNNSVNRLRGYLGWQPDDKDKLYVVGEYILNKNEWNFYSGYMRKAAKNLWLGLQYDVKHGRMATEAEYDLSRWWSVSHEYRSYDKQSEWGVKYKFHDFMSLKLMYDGDGIWLRAIGNL